MDRLPPLRLLTTFVEIARAGSMREAAARLNVTQPAITQALKALEAHVGVVLLDRGTRPARLTADGRQLAQATLEGLDLVTKTIEDLRIRNAAGHRSLTVACTLGMATHWLLPRLPDFYAENPDIFVNVQAPPNEAPRFTPGVDVILSYGRISQFGTRALTLFDERICPVGRPTLVQRLVSEGIELSDAPLIHVRSPDGMRWEGWADYLVATQRPTPRRPGEVFDNYVHAVQAAMSGRGLILGWRSITAQQVAEGMLVPWPGGEYDAGTGYFATWAHEPAAPATVSFLRWLETRDERSVA